MILFNFANYVFFIVMYTYCYVHSSYVCYVFSVLRILLYCVVLCIICV
jgi:hypothetical protein